MNPRELVAALGGTWLGFSGMVCCPAHPDKNPSLQISEGEHGKVLWHCFAGCSQDAVRVALVARGLWHNGTKDEQVKSHPRQCRGQAPVREHFYQNASGDVVFCNAKYPDGIGWRPWSKIGDQWQPNAHCRIPYALPEIIKSTDAAIILTEGERDADTLRQLGFTASSFKDWKPKWNHYLEPSVSSLRSATTIRPATSSSTSSTQAVKSCGFPPESCTSVSAPLERMSQSYTW